MVGPRKLRGGDPTDITIADIFTPTTLKQFFAKSWNRSLLHLAGREGRFGNAVGWSELNRILEECPLDSTNLRVMRNGKQVASQLYLTRTKSLDAGALSSLLAQGGTLVVDFLENILPGIGRMTEALTDAFRARVWVNLYASWGTESGLKLHKDSHEIIVLQLAGDKHWTVYAPTRLNPNEGDAFEAPAPDAKPVWEGVLGDGDMLYVPRGWPHIAVPTGKPSLHLTIGLTQPTGSSYLRWLADELDKNPEIRAAIPSSDTGRDTSDWLVEIHRLVEQAMSPASIDAFLSHEAAQQLARPRFSFPDFARLQPVEWSASTIFRLATTRKLDIQDSGDGTISVAAAKRQLTCPASIAAGLKLLSSNNSTSLESIEAVVEQHAIPELRRTLAIMVQLGILFSERDPHCSSPE